VEKFQEFSKWEQEVKRLEPWMLSEGLIQKVSLDPTPTSTSNSLLSATNNKDDIDESLAFATPRFQSKPLSPASPAANLDSFHSASSKNEKDDVSKFMLRPSQVSKRGKTFTSMEDIRKKSLIEKHATIQNPNNDLIISGMATLLSYLIEEPPDVYVKNQAWDIFSVPGDKTKIRAPLTTTERKKNAGKCVVKKAVVEGESNATVQCSANNHFLNPKLTAACHKRISINSLQDLSVDARVPHHCLYPCDSHDKALEGEIVHAQVQLALHDAHHTNGVAETVGRRIVKQRRLPPGVEDGGAQGGGTRFERHQFHGEGIFGHH